MGASGREGYIGTPYRSSLGTSAGNRSIYSLSAYERGKRVFTDGESVAHLVSSAVESAALPPAESSASAPPAQPSTATAVAGAANPVTAGEASAPAAAVLEALAAGSTALASASHASAAETSDVSP